MKNENEKSKNNREKIMKLLTFPLLVNSFNEPYSLDFNNDIKEENENESKSNN